MTHNSFSTIQFTEMHPYAWRRQPSVLSASGTDSGSIGCVARKAEEEGRGTLSATASLSLRPAMVVNSPGTHKMTSWPTRRICTSTMLGCLHTITCLVPHQHPPLHGRSFVSWTIVAPPSPFLKKHMLPSINTFPLPFFLLEAFCRLPLFESEGFVSFLLFCEACA